MSLEQKIDKLTLAIEAMTTTLLSVTSIAEVNTKTSATIQETVDAVTQVPDTITLDKTIPSVEDLKAACLKVARAAAENKTKVKTLLAEFDAKVVKDVAEGDRVTILNRLKNGEY